MNRKVVHDGFCKVEVLETEHGQREVVHCTHAVSVLIHDITNDRVLLVRQFRPALVGSEISPDGIIVETVAGRFDVDLGPKALIIKEAEEEAGITIREDQIELLNDGKPMSISAGLLTSLAYLAIARVTADQIDPNERIFGAPEEGEQIERVWVPVNELETIGFECTRAFALAQYLLRNL